MPLDYDPTVPSGMIVAGPGAGTISQPSQAALSIQEQLQLKKNIVKTTGISGKQAQAMIEAELAKQGGLTTQEPATAGFGLEAIIAALSAIGIAIPEPITTALGIAGLTYAGAQALGLGEGGGIGGINLLGGDTTTIPGTDIILQGPGLAEPYPSMIVKEWNANGSQFYLLTDGRIAVYSKRTKRWKAYRPPKLAVIGKNMPSHKMITRLRRNLKRHKDDARTILKLTDPVGYAKGVGYRKYKRR